MKAPVKFLVGLSLAAVLVLAGLATAGFGQMSLLALAMRLGFGVPDKPFDATELAQSLDYSDDELWAALPGSGSYAELMPEGLENPEQSFDRAVDVFFVHPTGYLRGDTWVWNLDPSSPTEQAIRMMMAGQASVFNGCCNIYAPRYRQANLVTYFKHEMGTDFQRIMRFAYSDVQAAFRQFIAQRNQGRPFIIASHSQGTHHAMVLLREEIDGTPLADRMIAAYLIGGRLSQSDLTGLDDITVCDSPTQLHCLVHWDTMSEEANVGRERAGNICVNPLSWRRNETDVPASEHDGAVLPPGQEPNAENQANDLTSAGTVVRQFTSARCGDGVLYIPDLAETPFKNLTLGTSYHMLDYQIFSLDLRNNAILRSQTYFQRIENKGGIP